MAFLASLQQDVVIDACEKMQDEALLIAAWLRRNEFLQQNQLLMLFQEQILLILLRWVVSQKIPDLIWTSSEIYCNVGDIS